VFDAVNQVHDEGEIVFPLNVAADPDLDSSGCYVTTVEESALDVGFYLIRGYESLGSDVFDIDKDGLVSYH